MICKNNITIAHYKNGKSQIMGSSEIIRKSLSINGNYTDEICNGKVQVSIQAISSCDDGLGSYPEIDLFFQCNKCGKTYQLDISIEDIENIINDNI